MRFSRTAGKFLSTNLKLNFCEFQSGSFCFPIEGIDKEVLADAETVSDALTITDEILGLYIDVLDQAVPWKTFRQTLAELEKFREDFSVDSSLLIGTIKSLMSNGIDAYYNASKYIFRWCDEATPLLSTYVELFRNDHTVEKAHTQKDILVEVLKMGITEMKTAQNAVSQSSISFNGAAGHLTGEQNAFITCNQFFKCKIS